MFKLNVDTRLSTWKNIRKKIDSCEEPLQALIDFWASTPYVLGSPVLNPADSENWPTPWEIIESNKYDDFTKAVMMGNTLLLTERYQNSKMQVRTLVDKYTKQSYNTLCIDDMWVLNFKDGEALTVACIPEDCILENLVELRKPR